MQQRKSNICRCGYEYLSTFTAPAGMFITIYECIKCKSKYLIYDVQLEEDPVILLFHWDVIDDFTKIIETIDKAERLKMENRKE